MCKFEKCNFKAIINCKHGERCDYHCCRWDQLYNYLLSAIKALPPTHQCKKHCINVLQYIPSFRDSLCGICLIKCKWLYEELVNLYGKTNNPQYKIIYDHYTAFFDKGNVQNHQITKVEKASISTFGPANAH